MRMSVICSTVNGQIVEENRGGVICTYVLDTIGSVIQILTVSERQTPSANPWSFAEVKTSTNDGPTIIFDDIDYLGEF